MVYPFIRVFILAGKMMIQFPLRYNSEYTLPLFALCYLFMIGGLFVTLFIVAYDYIKMYAQNRSLKRELRYYIRLSQENQISKSDLSKSSEGTIP